MTAYTWIAGSGDWLTAGDWSPTGLPGDDDIVYFSQGGQAYDVTTNNQSADFVEITSASATLEDNGAFSASEIIISAGAFTVDADDSVQAGTIQVSGGALNVYGTVNGGTILEYSGSINLQAGATLENVTFDGVLNVNATDLSPVSVEGFVTYSDETGNNGGIVVISAGTLDIEAYSDLAANTIELKGGTLSLNGGVSATIVLEGGSISFADDSVLSNVTFDGEVNILAGDIVVIAAQSLTINDVSGNNPGVLNIANDDQLDFVNSNSFNSVFDVDDMTINLGDAASSGYLAEVSTSSSPLTLMFGDGVTLNSMGLDDVIFDAQADASSIVNSGAIHQLNASGSLTLGVFLGSITNEGLIDSYSGGTIMMVGAAIRNTGIIAIGNSSELETYADSFVNNIAGRATIGAGSSWELFNSEDDQVTPATFKNLGSIILGGGLLFSYTASLVFTNTATGTIFGYGSLQLASLVNQGVIEASGGVLNVTSKLTGAGALKVDAGATLQLSGASTIGSAVTGGGVFQLSATAATTFATGATVSTTNGVINGGAIYIGTAGMSAPVSVTIDALQNTGVIKLTGGATQQALLNLGSPAGFGTAGSVTGTVLLYGDSAISFATGGITSIASGAFLDLDASNAYLELASTPGSNSALTGLATIYGALALDNGATLATSGGLVNKGITEIDFRAANGSSILNVGGRLTNTGSFRVGDATLSSSDTVTASSLTNYGSLYLIGYGTAAASLNVSGAVTNNGIFSLTADAETLSSAVGGVGSFLLKAGSTLTFGSSVAAGQTVQFSGADTLALGHANTFHGMISNFGAGDLIDAISLINGTASFNFVENSANTGGTLTLTSGAQSANLLLAGVYNNTDFTLAADAGTGTLVKFV